MHIAFFLGVLFSFLCTNVEAGPTKPHWGPGFGASWAKPGARGPQPGLEPIPKALYLISNLSPNNVIALTVNSEGIVSEGTVTPTGGNGGALLSADGIAPAPVDALASQDAVVRVCNTLYVVNAGSDSLSVFAIDPQDPTKLSLIGSPTPLIGHFPVTIGVSEALHLVCVGTAGVNNGVECFTEKDGHLTPDGLGLRAFDIAEQSPPLGNTNAISDLFFSSDLKWLYAPVKGNTMSDLGWLSVFPISDGLVSKADIRSYSPEISLLFGGFQSPHNPTEIFVADSSFGAVVYQIADNGTGTVIGKGLSSPHVPGTCWAEYSSVTNSAWVTSPVSNALMEFDVESAALIAQTNITDANTGILDFVIPSKYLYGLASGSVNGTDAAIVVVDISKESGEPKTVQYLPLGHGLNNYAHGLAYWA